MTSMIGYQGSGPSGASLRGKSSGEIIPKGYKKGQLTNFTPEQMQLFQSLFSHVSPDSYLSKLAGGDEALFEQMEGPAMRKFQELQGQLGSRFSGMGMGARHGSGFQNAANQATSDFAMDLASRRQQLQLQAIRELMGLSSNLLNQEPYEQFLIEKGPKKKSFLQQLGGGILRAGGTAAGSYFGGPAGAQLGYQTGDAFANAFGI
jgi:hypothetical protein